MSRIDGNIPHTIVLLGGEGLRPDASGLWDSILQMEKNTRKTISLIHASSQGSRNISQQERRIKIAVDALIHLGITAHVIDAASANVSDVADMVYLTGTSPPVIVDSLAGTDIRDSICSPQRLLIASSSAAVAIGEHIFTPLEPFPAALDDLTFQVSSGLGLIPGIMILPYFSWLQDIVIERISKLIPNLWLVGIDDQAALIIHYDRWEIAGLGTVTLFKHGERAKSLTLV